MYSYLISIMISVTAHGSCNKLSELQKLQQTAKLISVVSDTKDESNERQKQLQLNLKLN
jgi:hypothetical protein